jgi:transposase
MQTQINKLDFKGQKVFVGIDTHLRSWRVSIMINGLMAKTFSQNPDTDLLKDYLTKNYPGGEYHSAYEAGFIGFSIHRKLIKSGINNIIVNPADIPTTDKEIRQKEDKRDSRKIVRSLHNGDLKGIHVPSIEIDELRSFVRYRKTVVKEINRHKNQSKFLLYYYGISIPDRFSESSKSWSKSYTSWLKEVEFETEFAKRTLNNIISTVEFQREKLLQANRTFKELAETGQYANDIRLLRSVPGIGIIVAMTIITELDCIIRFTNIDKLCSYVGLIPRTNSSGDKDKTGPISPRSNRMLRGMLVESAWIAIRQDPALMLSYQTLCKRMEPNKAIIRITKKLLSRIQYVLKNNTKYEKSIVNVK